MNPRELEHLEKKSIFILRLSNELKNNIINSQLLELNKSINLSIKKKKVVVMVFEVN